VRKWAVPAIAGVLALSAASARAAEPLDAASFADPPASVHPAMRWWWGPIFGAPPGAMSPAETRKELGYLADAGFKRVEIAFSTAKWATAEQRENLDAALDEAARRGVTIDMTVGAQWPVRSPDTAPGTGLSEQELQYGRVDVAGGSTFDGAVPLPYDTKDTSRNAKRFAVTAARVVRAGPPVTTLNTPPASSTVLDPTSLVDLTSQVGDGKLTWTAPAGDWVVFGFWARDSSEGVVDHFRRASIDAATAYVEQNQFSSSAAGQLRSVGGSFFEDSLEIDADGIFWTPEMAAQFQARRGYGLTKYLPLVFQQGVHRYWVPETLPIGDFDRPDGAGARVRHDYAETLTDLYVDQHLKPLQEWAVSHGVKFRAQAAFGQNLDPIRSARELARMGGLADDESLNAGDEIPNDLVGNAKTWRFAFDHHRTIAGGSHQGGSNAVSTELGAMLGLKTFEFNLGDYKTIMDKEWAAGTTTPLIHGYAYQTSTAVWPGDHAFGGFVPESWNAETYPQWGDWKPLTDYWARGTSVLQAGTARTDVALYRDGFLTTAALGFGRSGAIKGLFDAVGMEKAGYSLEYIDPNGVVDPAADGAGVLYPNGPRYRAVVLDERALPAKVAAKLADEAAQGLRVVLVGAVPNADTGYPGDDARVQDAVARLVAQPTVARVATQADAAGALARLGVVPAAKWSTPAQVYTQHRETADADYFYVYNATNDPEAIDGSFAATGRPYTLDLWTGAVRRLAVWSAADGRTTVPLRLPALGTTVLAFKKSERSPARHVTSTSPVHETVADGNLVELRDVTGGQREVRFSDGTTSTVTLPGLPAPASPGTWHLHVDGTSATGTTPHDLDLTRLEDWRTLPGLAAVSGKGAYTTTLTLPESWTARDRGTYLELGAVSGTVEVFVNGAKAAPDSVTGRDWDISALLRPGGNDLRVELATTLRNAVPGGSQAYGLLGPVRLVPFGRAAVNWATGDGSVGGTVPATLSLALGTPGSFGAFQPGVDRVYDTTVGATVTSTAGDATLSVSDPSGDATGRLTNGGFALDEPLQAKAGTGAFAPLSTTAGAPLALRAYTGPVSNDAVTIGLRQHIAANQALRTGAYRKTLTFTLSTTTP
jgi:hypothetical protein